MLVDINSMKGSFAFALIITGILLLMMTYCGEDDHKTSGQHSETYAHGTQTLNYLVFFPDNYTPESQWPLIVYLHGASLRGDNPLRLLAYGPPRLVTTWQNFPFILLSPQCPAGKSWNEVAMLPMLIRNIVDLYAIDEKRIYLTGVSLGGNGAWYWGAEMPETFAAIAPLCGFADPAQAAKLVQTPVWVFHGALDKKVPSEMSDKMVTALRNLDANVRYKKFPNIGHNIVERVYRNRKLYDWFLEHQRNG